MKTALYQGRRVQVVGESLLMAFYYGKWYPTGDKCPLVCEIGDNPISAFDVEASELSDYQDSEIDKSPPQYIKAGTIVTIKG